MTLANPGSPATTAHSAGVGPAAKLRANGAGSALAAASASGSAASGAADAFATLLEGMCSDGNVEAADPGSAVLEAAAAAADSGTGQSDRAAAPAAANPLALIAQAALVPLPAQPATAAILGERSRGPEAGDADGSAAPNALAGARSGIAGTKPNLTGAKGTAALPADDGPALGRDAAPAARPTDGFAALLAQSSAAATGLSSEARASARHGIELPSALAMQAPGQPAPAAPTQAPAAAVHQAALPSRPLDAAFAGDLAAEVKWMVDAGTQRAELHLNPADLGPIHIELSLTAQTADISFAVAHSTTRDGIAQALPALREMLAGQGLSLGHAGVSSGQQDQAFADAQRQARAMTQGPASSAAAGDPAGSGAAPRVITLRAGRGVLDLYA